MSINMESDISIRDQWASEHATRGLKELLNKKLVGGPGPSQRPFLPDEPLPPLPSHISRPPSGENGCDDDDDSSSDSASTTTQSSTIEDPKVAIIGAGAAGLFSAMIWDYLNNDKTLQEKGFKVSYEIFEAADRDRIGGRIFTYNFKPEGTRNPFGQHDYYDVGAMRFPANKVMTRLFDLFKQLKMEKKDLSDNPPLGSLVPYYIQNLNDKGAGWEPWCFNNFTEWGSYKKLAEEKANYDAFHFNDDVDDASHKIPESILKKFSDAILNHIVDDLRKALKEDLKSSSFENQN